MKTTRRILRWIWPLLLAATLWLISPAGAQTVALKGGQIGDMIVRGISRWDNLRPSSIAGYVLTSNGPAQKPSWKAAPGAAGGDSLTVNAGAVVDADLNDTTPTAPSTGENVRFQKDASSPALVSAYVREASATLRGILQLAGQLGGSAASPDVRGLRETGGPTLLTLGAVADGQVLTRSGATIVGGAGGGGGDNVSVNGTAASDADLDDATPAAPTDGDSTFDALNVKWQKDASTPNNVSAFIGKDANGNYIIGFDPQASAVNYVGVRNAATGLGPLVMARGSNVDVDLRLAPKGAGVIHVGDASVGAPLEFTEQSAPATPPTNHLRFWTEDSASPSSTLKSKDDAGHVYDYGLKRVSGNSGAAGPNETWQVLTANATANSTTTLTTVMTTTGLPAGTWYFEYHVIWQSATTTVGVNFSVDAGGTVTRFRANRHYQSTGAAAATGIADGAATTLTGQLVEHMSTRADNGSLGPNTGVDTINVDQYDVIRGVVVTSTSGDLQLKHASETATSTQVMADTQLILRRIA